MSDGSSNSSVKIVAILAVLVLVGAAAWFIWGRSQTQPAATTTSQPEDADIHVKVDLPDTVTIKP